MHTLELASRDATPLHCCSKADVVGSSKNTQPSFLGRGGEGGWASLQSVLNSVLRRQPLGQWSHVCTGLREDRFTVFPTGERVSAFYPGDPGLETDF